MKSIFSHGCYLYIVATDLQELEEFTGKDDSCLLLLQCWERACVIQNILKHITLKSCERPALGPLSSAKLHLEFTFTPSEVIHACHLFYIKSNYRMFHNFTLLRFTREGLDGKQKKRADNDQGAAVASVYVFGSRDLQ